VIEFLWSRVALTACGLAVMAVIMASFASLDDSSTDRAAIDGATELGELLERFPGCGEGASMVIEASRFLPTPEHSLIVANGSVWTMHDGKRTAVECSAPVLLCSNGEAAATLELRYGQSVRLENRIVDSKVLVTVQLEKVSTISFTASTNLLHSASVL
jgi:hypothetical protein